MNGILYHVVNFFNDNFDMFDECLSFMEQWFMLAMLLLVINVILRFSSQNGTNEKFLLEILIMSMWYMVYDNILTNVDYCHVPFFWIMFFSVLTLRWYGLEHA
jgi:hypothetical protein